ASSPNSSSNVPTATPSRARPSASRRWTGSFRVAGSNARSRLCRRQFARTTASSSFGACLASWLLTFAPTLMGGESTEGSRNLGADEDDARLDGAAERRLGQRRLDHARADRLRAARSRPPGQPLPARLP